MRQQRSYRNSTSSIEKVLSEVDVRNEQYSNAAKYGEQLKKYLGKPELLEHYKELKEKNFDVKLKNYISTTNLYTALGSLVSDEEIEKLAAYEANLLVYTPTHTFGVVDYIRILIKLISDHLVKTGQIQQEDKHKIVTDIRYTYSHLAKDKLIVYLVVHNNLIIIKDQKINFRVLISYMHLTSHIVGVMLDRANQTILQIERALHFQPTYITEKTKYFHTVHSMKYIEELENNLYDKSELPYENPNK